MCAVLVAHGYISLTQFGKNLNSAQLVEETVEEEQSETKDGKSESEELVKKLQEFSEFVFTLYSTFTQTIITKNEEVFCCQFQEIHLPPPDKLFS